MLCLAMPLCIFTLFYFALFTAGSAPFLLVISTTRSVACCIRSVAEYIFSAVIILLGLITSFVLIVLFCHIMQTLLGRIPSGHFILRHLEKRIKAQVKAICLKEKKTADLIHQHLDAIDQWDMANDQLLIEIRAAEYMIGKKVWDWKIVPERHPHSKTAGSAYFVHGRFSPRPLEAPEASAWSIVRWWSDEEDPRLWAAKAKLTHKTGVLSDKRAILTRLQKENEDLTVKRDDAVKKRDAVQWGPCQPKQIKNTWAEKHLSIMNRPIASHQPAPAQEQTNFFRRDVDLTNERIHYCEFCGRDGHRWRNQYTSFALANEAAYVRPCPTAATRVRARPHFVSAGSVGGPSFFAPDKIVTPRGPPHGFTAPPPLFVSPNLAPSVPLFSAPSTSSVPPQAKAPFSSVVSAQASVPKVSVPVQASPASAPKVSLDTSSSSSSSSATPVATSIKPAAAAAVVVVVAATAPIVKTAPAAPRGKGPPSALQIVWPGQNPAGASTTGPAVGGSLMSRSSFAPTPGSSAAFPPSEPGRTSALGSQEQAAAALVKEEAEARALEKAAAKRQKKDLSTPQVKKNYRF